MPTKCPEYMISGTPILLFAPAETEIVRYCRKNRCAKIVTENSEDRIVEAIKELIYNKAEREQIAASAKETAMEYHDSLKVTNAFEKVISALLVESE